MTRTPPTQRSRAARSTSSPSPRAGSPARSPISPRSCSRRSRPPTASTANMLAGSGRAVEAARAGRNQSSLLAGRGRGHDLLRESSRSRPRPAVLPHSSACSAALTRDMPACYLIVQHLPDGFSTSFARRLNSVSDVEVKEAEAGMSLGPGTALLAPYGAHMVVSSASGTGRIAFEDAPPAHGVRPAADPLFESVAQGVRLECHRCRADRDGVGRREGTRGHQGGRWRHHRPERGDERRVGHAGRGPADGCRRATSYLSVSSPPRSDATMRGRS